MKLPLPFLNNKKTDSDFYLALILSDEKAAAIILRAEETNIKMIGHHEESFPTHLEDLSQEEFINGVDKAISRAEEVLPPHIETHKTVFGVKADWVEPETKKIKKEYLDKLKKVCDALDLSPIGFMVTSEAVTHLIQDEEGAPLSAVFAEIGKHKVTLSLLRGGKIVEAVTSLPHESAPEAVDKLLSHFTVPVLPARIIIFQSKPDADMEQVFTKHQWSKSLPFLHVPQITVLPKAYDSRAVMFGAASQMGFTVVDTPTHVLPTLTSAVAVEETIPQSVDAEPQNDVVLPELAEDINTPEDTERELEEAVPDRAGAFGFVLDGEPEAARPEPQHVASDNLEMPINQDNFARPQFDDEDEAESDSRHSRGTKKAALAIPGIAMLKNLKMPNTGALFAGLKGKKTPFKIIIPLVILLILIGGTSFLYIYGTKATVQLTVTPNIVNEEQKVTFSVTNPSNFDDSVISAKSVSVSLPATASTDATGKKDVGEKAKGTITIYNNSDNSVTLSSGTEFKASNGQVFILDKDTKLASSSGDIFSGTKPGTTQASVTAKELGTDGNLPSGTRFAVGTTSSIAARNDSAFSGGTKKNVTVVSKADLEKLRADLAKSNQSDAKSKLTEQASDQQTVLPFISTPTVQDAKFDKKEGDEAQKVSVKASIVFTGMAYQNDDMKEYAKKILNDKYKDNVTLEEKTLKETVDTAEVSKDAKSAKATVTLQGGLLPKVDTQDVIDNIKDHSIGQANKIIGNLPQVTKTAIVLSPPMPIISNLFPRLPKQISVEVKTE